MTLGWVDIVIEVKGPPGVTLRIPGHTHGLTPRRKGKGKGQG
jgi:hypothetical protein